MLSRGRDVLVCSAGSRGFSLIEVLAALAVMGLALTVLYQSASTATSSVRVASEYAEALALGESMLDAFSAQSPPKKQDGGRFGRFEWSATAEPFSADEISEQPAEAGFPPLMQVTLTVNWAGQGRERELTLQTVNYGGEASNDL